jgi:hypothetical protein
MISTEKTKNVVAYARVPPSGSQCRRRRGWVAMSLVSVLLVISVLLRDLGRSIDTMCRRRPAKEGRTCYERFQAILGLTLGVRRQGGRWVPEWAQTRGG